MKTYRAEIHGHIIELRKGELVGGEQLVVDGRLVSNKPLAGFLRGSHFFEIKDEQGRVRNVEVRLIDLSKIGLGKYRAVISVDGVERARLDPIDLLLPLDVCANCGYTLLGLPVENREVRCPECGRHTSVLDDRHLRLREPQG